MIGYGNSMFLATHGILARSASGGAVDPDAQAFITAASITDPTQQSAINQLVVDLKGYSIWSIPNLVIYPMVGGTNTSTSYNLRNPAQFQISWIGGVVSSNNGVQFNGMNSYGNTGYIPTTVGASINSFHVSLYSRTNTNTGVDMGVQRGTTYLLNAARSSGQAYTSINSQSFEVYSNSDGTGFYLGNRQASNDSDAWKNGVKQVNGTNTTNPSEFPNIAIFIGAFNSLGSAAQFTNKQLAFVSMGGGMTDTQAVNFRTAVQAFNTTLGRQV